MRRPLANNAAPAVPAASSDHATPACAAEARPKATRPFGGEDEDQDRAQKAECDLKAARTKISQLTAYLTFATTENIKLRAQLEGREVDEMAAELQAQIPRADLHGEGTVV